MDIHLKHTNSFSSGLVKLNNALYKSILPWGFNTTSRWRSLSTTMPQLFQYFKLRNGMTIWVSVQLRKWVVDWHCSKFQFIDQYWHKSLISIGKWIKGGQWLIQGFDIYDALVDICDYRKTEWQHTIQASHHRLHI